MCFIIKEFMQQSFYTLHNLAVHRRHIMEVNYTQSTTLSPVAKFLYYNYTIYDRQKIEI